MAAAFLSSPWRLATVFLVDWNLVSHEWLRGGTISGQSGTVWISRFGCPRAMWGLGSLPPECEPEIIS